MIRDGRVVWLLFGAVVALIAGEARAITPLNDAVEIAAGVHRTCVLTTAGGVKCWGGPYVGDGTAKEAPGAVAVPNLSGVTSLGVGWSDTCIVRSGEVRCWGSGLYLATSAIPQVVPGLESGVVQVTGGYAHRCVVTAVGGAMCWGNNNDGALGNGTNFPSFALPTHVAGLTAGVASVDVGMDTGCALTTGGAVWCWGRRMGATDTTLPRAIYFPEQVSGLASGVSQLSVGSRHACARLGDGSVRCWGANTSGQLGDGTMRDSLVPVAVASPPGGYVAVRAGDHHTCAQKASGGLVCWGGNDHGQLGTGNGVSVATPHDVVGLPSDPVAFDAGYDQTCAVFADGSARCWGGNYSGQLGIGRIDTSTNVPLSAVGLTASAITAGGDGSCAVRSNGGAACWGRNEFGQLGIGTTVSAAVPTEIVGLGTSVTRVALQYGHGCAITAGGEAHCWGWNAFGQLGTGNTVGSSVPVGVVGLSTGTTAIAPGSNHTCAVVQGTAKCWGSNGSGQLGRPGNDAWSPTDVVGLAGMTASVASGGSNSCAVTSQGAAKCWGSNWNGQLGNGEFAPFSATPVDVIGLGSGVAAVSVGVAHACAVTTSGAVKCWGANGLGRLGVSGPDRATPVDVPGLASGAVAIAAGDSHTCALMQNGRVKCWGWNRSGQTGGAIGGSTGVVEVQRFAAPAVAIAAGSSHSCALLASGETQCWGYGYYGQLGTGRFGYHTTPMPVVHAGCIYFDDVDRRDAFCSHVEWMYNRGITLGCASGSYCPAGITTRLALAAFQQRLAAAVGPALLAKTSSGALPLGNGPFASALRCVSDALDAAPHPRRLHVDGVWRLHAAGPLDLTFGVWISGGETVPWAPLYGSEQRVTRASGGWANVRVLGGLDIAANETPRVALGAYWQGSVPVNLDENCMLRIRIESRDGAMSPF